MTAQEEQISRQLTGAASTNRVLAVILIAFMLLVGASLWLFLERYQRLSSDAEMGAAAAREHGHRIGRLERDYERLAERIDRRMANIEVGMQDIQLYVAEQRGRENR